MELLFVLALVVGAIFLFVKLKSKGYFEANQRPLTRMETFAKKFPDVDASLYQMRFKVMNNSEASFFHLIQKYLPEGHHVFPKMRIADVIKTKNSKGYYKQRNRILPKHIDFLVCDQDLKPLYAVEIDGRSHDNPERQERDELVDYIFESINLPLKRVRVGSDFEAIVSEMAQVLKQ